MSGPGTGPTAAARLIDLVVDRGLLPDPALRWAIRRLLARRRRALAAGGVEARVERTERLIAAWRREPVSRGVAEANAQHYEVPTGLYQRMLGPRLKYSSAWWPEGVETLAAAEAAMLDLTVERAGLVDGQDVLDLGCGWGSLTLHVAERHPRSRIVAVSNSRTQRAHIEAEAARRGLDNVVVRTADVARLGVDEHADVVGDDAFDRVVSVELFEHLRNHAELGRRIAGWLRADGRLFVHVFCHHRDAYPFDVGGSGDWMARHFFTDGIMPSLDLLPRVLDELRLQRRWAVSGAHYARTLRAWLAQLDADPAAVEQALAGGDPTVAPAAARRRWRTFLMACEELFATGGGDEWHVAHYLLAPRVPAGSEA